MAASSSGPPGGPRYEPPGNSRQPHWMRSADDMGTMVLLLRRRTSQDTAGNKVEQNVTMPLSNPFIVGTSIELAVGTKVEATREGRGSRYLLRTSSKTVYNKLLMLTELTDGTQVEIISHPTLNSVQGTVYDPDTKDMDEKDILGILAPQGVHSVRRIKKRVNNTVRNTPLLVLSFYGTQLPTTVYFGLCRIPVKVYYPYPMICFNCGDYGHSRKTCQNCGVCLQCSQTHELAEGDKCQNTPHCLHCKNEHAITSRDCPKYKSEEKIIRIKVDQGISFPEARRIYTEETKKETFANVLQDRLNRELAIKDQIIAELQKQVAALAKELSELKDVLKSKSNDQAPVATNAKASNSRKPLSQTSTSTNSSITAMPAPAPQNKSIRMSRKDKSDISPPTPTSSRNDIRTYDLRNRSRSGKRHMDMSPSTGRSQGKRFSALPSSSDPIDIDE